MECKTEYDESCSNKSDSGHNKTKFAPLNAEQNMTVLAPINRIQCITWRSLLQLIGWGTEKNKSCSIKSDAEQNRTDLAPINRNSGLNMKKFAILNRIRNRKNKSCSTKSEYDGSCFNKSDSLHVNAIYDIFCAISWNMLTELNDCDPNSIRCKHAESTWNN